MEEHELKLTAPDPYESAFHRVVAEFNHRLQVREIEGIEAALKEYGYVKERTCTVENEEHVYLERKLSCGHSTYDEDPFFCPKCGARIIRGVK